jgi:anti-sigma B factor antagonist
MPLKTEDLSPAAWSERPAESDMDQGGLEIDVELLSETTFVWVSGEIDIATAPRLTAALDMHLRGGAPVVVLDLHEVTFCGCVGFALLVDAVARARALGVTLSLVPNRLLLRTAAAVRLTEQLGLAGYVSSTSAG